MAQATRLLELTLVELTATLRARRASPVELMTEVFAAIDRDNPTLNAVVAQHPRGPLLSLAREAEARLARGEGRPLEGIPLGVKDLEDAVGLPTSHGTKPLAGQIADHSSTQVQRLERAGAIVVGKTNTPEFGATAITKNLVFGATRSPWDVTRTPGGSSGGAAAAIAAEMLPLVTGSDGGGSIRIPASFVGAFGLKPSYGRIPRGPSESWDHGETSVYGPLTKTVEDAALVLDQVVGYAPTDPRSLPHPGISYLETVRRPFTRRLRIGWTPDLGFAVVQSDVGRVAEEAVRVLSKLGHDVIDLPQGPPDVAADWGLIGAYEIGGRIARLRPEHDGDFTRGLLETVRFAEGMTQRLWGEISRRRAELVLWCAKAISEYDLLAMPTVPYDPPPASGPFPSETEGRAQRTAGVAAFTIPFNLSLQPAATVRAGLSKAGLPVGLQLVAAHHAEDLLLAVCRSYERERPWADAWPARVRAS